MRKEVIGNATLYLGNCVEILPTIGNVDAVVTDPPYGVGIPYASYEDTEANWEILMGQVMPLLLAPGFAQFVVMPCCRQDRLAWWYASYRPTWMLAWHKGSPGQRSHIGFQDWEPHLAWGKPPVPMHDYFSTPTGFDDPRHPCPKPKGWAQWLVARAAAKNKVIVDPFMGSGTVGAACSDLGRNFVGIELDPKYFEVACERITNAQRQERLFA